MRNEGRSSENSQVDLHLNDPPMPNSESPDSEEPVEGFGCCFLVIISIIVVLMLNGSSRAGKIEQRLDALEKRIPVPAEATKP